MVGIQNVIIFVFFLGGGSGLDFIGGVQDKLVDVIGEMFFELVKYCCCRMVVEIFEEICI